MTTSQENQEYVHCTSSGKISKADLDILKGDEGLEKQFESSVRQNNYGIDDVTTNVRLPSKMVAELVRCQIYPARKRCFQFPPV